MTIPASTRKAGPYTGNGVVTAFDFAFKVFTKNDIRVIRAVAATGVESTLVLDTDYSVTLNADQDADPGGSITYPLVGVAMPATHTLTAVGSLEVKQATDIPDGGAFNASTIESAVDYQNILIQQLDEKIGRAVLVTPSSATDPQILIAALFAASDAAATSAGSASASKVSAAAAEVAAAASAAAAAASAASTTLPASLAGKASNMLRVKADETGYEHRTAAQVRSDIGAAATGDIPNAVTKTVIYAASGTYTVPATVRAIKVEAVGGGGGGGYGKGTAANCSVGAGGGAGSFGVAYVLKASLGATVAVTIGAAGVGGVAASSSSATAGGATSFGAHLLTNGGSGGGATSATTTSGGSAAGAPGGAVGSAGLVNSAGRPGGRGIIFSGDIGFGGEGGGSPFGAGGAGAGATAVGGAASGYGAAGGGAAAAGASDADGGAGTVGLVVITEYY